MLSIIDDSPEIKITNMDQLPPGLGCSLLLVFKSSCPNQYAAVRWLRKMPTTTHRCYHVLRVQPHHPNTK